jgi:hypothetical protein
MASKSRQKPLALEHFDRQFVAIIEHGVDSRAKPQSHTACLSFQAQDSTSAGRGLTFIHISTNHATTPLQTSRMQIVEAPALRASLSLARLKAASLASG